MAEQTLPVTLTLKRSTVEAFQRSDGQHHKSLAAPSKTTSRLHF